MEHKESERSGFQERENRDFPEEVHIRQEDRGIMMYAVFDGEEQVSKEFGPLDENPIIHFIEGYSAGKEKYSE